MKKKVVKKTVKKPVSKKFVKETKKLVEKAVEKCHNDIDEASLKEVEKSEMQGISHFLDEIVNKIMSKRQQDKPSEEDKKNIFELLSQIAEKFKDGKIDSFIFASVGDTLEGKMCYIVGTHKNMDRLRNILDFKVLERTTAPCLNYEEMK